MARVSGPGVEGKRLYQLLELESISDEGDTECTAAMIHEGWRHRCLHHTRAGAYGGGAARACCLQARVH